MASIQNAQISSYDNMEFYNFGKKLSDVDIDCSQILNLLKLNLICRPYILISYCELETMVMIEHLFQL